MKIRVLILSLCSLFAVSRSQAQVADVKANLLMGAAAIFNPSIELGFAERSAITMDYVGAFAKDNYMGTGYPFMTSMGFFGYRHYLLDKESHSGLFVGGDFGLYVFRMNKNIVPLVAHDHGDWYDVGYGYMLGVTVGYKYLFGESKRWGLEASLSGGWQHAQHEGYSPDGTRLFEINASGEWLPYKAGIYLTYRLF